MICARGRINKSNLVSAKRYEFWREIAVTRYHVNIINIIIELLIELKGNNNNNNNKNISPEISKRGAVWTGKKITLLPTKKREKRKKHILATLSNR